SLDQLVHAAGGDTGEVAVRHDGDQGRFGAFAALEQPLGKVGAGAELGHSHVDGAHAGIEVAVAVAVALGGPLGAGPAILRAGDGVGVGGQQIVDDPLEHGAHQIRGRFTEVFSPGRSWSAGAVVRGVKPSG